MVTFHMHPQIETYNHRVCVDEPTNNIDMMTPWRKISSGSIVTFNQYWNLTLDYKKNSTKIWETDV